MIVDDRLFAFFYQCRKSIKLESISPASRRRLANNEIGVGTLKKRVETATNQFDLDKAKSLLAAANAKLAAELTAASNKEIFLLKTEERLERV